MNLSINPNFLVKLDESTYLIWREQLRHVITVHGLHSLIDGSTVTLDKFVEELVQITRSDKIISTQEILIPNHAFEAWDKNDCVVNNWIYSSMSPSFLK